MKRPSSLQQQQQYNRTQGLLSEDKHRSLALQLLSSSRRWLAKHRRTIVLSVVIGSFLSILTPPSRWSSTTNFLKSTITSHVQKKNPDPWLCRSPTQNVNKLKTSRYEFPKILSSTNTISSRNESKKNAIVYLTRKDSVHFNRSMDLLYQNYLSIHPHHAEDVDIFLFYTEDITIEDVHAMEEQYPNCTFRLIDLRQSKYWSVPDHLEKDDYATWIGHPYFSVGYRLMCRFFARTLYDFLRDLAEKEGSAYQYVLRLDDDSFILSPISYDLFNFMNDNQYSYAYRLCTYEMENPMLPANYHSPAWPTMNRSSIGNGLELWNRYEQHVQTCHPRNGQPLLPEGVPYRPLDRRLCAFYNNFFMANVSFVLQPDVQDFLQWIDDTGIIFRERMGDLTIQTIAMYAFAPSAKIHRFLDWTYQHMKIETKGADENNNSTTCPVWGALQAGYLDVHVNDTFALFAEKLECPRWETSPIKYYLSSRDLSPNHAHLPKEYADNIQLNTIREAIVELPGMGDLSG